MEQEQCQHLGVNKKIDLKPWLEYTSAEKLALLSHWWRTFGIFEKRADIYAEFLMLLREDLDCLWYIAVIGYMNGKGNECLIDAIRHDEIAETIIKAYMTYALASVKNDTAEFDKITSAETQLLTDIVASYNNSLYIKDESNPHTSTTPDDADDTKIIRLQDYTKKGQ